MARVPKYRKHSTRNRALVEINGKRTLLAGEYGSPESIDHYHRILSGGTISNQILAEPGTTTIAVLTVLFLEWAESRYAGNQASALRSGLRPLVDMYSDVPAAEFGPLKLKQLRDSLPGTTYTSAKIERVVTRQYVNRLLKFTRQMFRWGVSEEIIPPSIYEALKTVYPLRRGQAPETPKRQPVAWKDIEPVVERLSPVVAAMVLLQWHTGARSGSICEAKPEQFDRSVTPWVWHPRHKTEHRGAVLTIYIGPQCRELLTPYFDRAADAHMFSPREHRRKPSPHHGVRYTTNTYWRAVKNARLSANRGRKASGQPEIAAWTPHQIRHAKATAVRAKYGLEASQAILGHDSIDATQIYAQKQLDAAKKIAESDG